MLPMLAVKKSLWGSIWTQMAQITQENCEDHINYEIYLKMEAGPRE